MDTLATDTARASRSPGQGPTQGKVRVSKDLAIPREGDNGLYTQTWFPICQSIDVGAGEIVGRAFLGGKVIVFRDADGQATVKSGVCLHLGADLSNGKLIDGKLRCPYHHWTYGMDGACVATGAGDPPPPRARLFNFPPCEMYGLIWAFNGEEPLFLLKQQIPYPEDEIILRVMQDPRDWRIDPWVIRANTPDWQHLKFVHNLDFDWSRVNEAFEWWDHGCHVKIDSRMRDRNMERYLWDMTIQGTNIWTDTGTYKDRWHFTMSALTIPEPGRAIHYSVNAVHRGDGSTEQERSALDHLAELEEIFEDIVSQDDIPLSNLHYAPRFLTKTDEALARYLRYVKAYPRANPAAELIS